MCVILCVGFSILFYVASSFTCYLLYLLFCFVQHNFLYGKHKVIASFSKISLSLSSLLREKYEAGIIRNFDVIVHCCVNVTNVSLLYFASKEPRREKPSNLGILRSTCKRRVFCVFLKNEFAPYVYTVVCIEMCIDNKLAFHSYLSAESIYG